MKTIFISTTILCYAVSSVIVGCSQNTGLDETDKDALIESSSDTNTDNNAYFDTDSDTYTYRDTNTESDIETEMPELRSKLPYETSPNVEDKDFEQFVTNTNEFGFSLFRRLANDNNNMVFSPLSIATALGMTYAGARGNTEAEMAQAMQNDLPTETFHAAANRLMIAMSDCNIADYEPPDGTGKKSLQLSLVNALWAQRDYSIEEPFLDILSVNYDSGTKILDFMSVPENSRLIINDWVSDNTNSKIKELLPPDAVSRDTRLILTNALYFYGTWSNVFDVKNTKNAAFHTSTENTVFVPMMANSAGYPNGKGDMFQIVEIPYIGNEITMTVIIPEEGKLADIRNMANSDWLADALESINVFGEARLTFPKFSFTWGSHFLKEQLISLGMVDAFEKDTSNFSGINNTEKLFINDVVHQAFIGVDEYGTEAAAATAVIMDGYTSVPPEIVVDRPFLFFIRNKLNGIILFAGQVTDPS